MAVLGVANVTGCGGMCCGGPTCCSILCVVVALGGGDPMSSAGCSGTLEICPSAFHPSLPELARHQPELWQISPEVRPASTKAVADLARNRRFGPDSTPDWGRPRISATRGRTAGRSSGLDFGAGVCSRVAQRSHRIGSGPKSSAPAPRPQVCALGGASARARDLSAGHGRFPQAVAPPTDPEWRARGRSG